MEGGRQKCTNDKVLYVDEGEGIGQVQKKRTGQIREKPKEEQSGRKRGGREWSEKVTFSDQSLFVVTFSHLCSSLMPRQCALVRLSPIVVTSVLPLRLLALK